MVLLGAEEGGFTKGVEAIAKVKSENSITITIQKSIEGIKVCLCYGGNHIIAKTDIPPAKIRYHYSRTYKR